MEGDTVLLPGVELIETSGHVPGHQSVLVRLPDTGSVLLAIDAVPMEAMSDSESRIMLPNDEDEAETRASTRKLAEIARREGVTLIVYGHDAEQWPTLRHSPEFYTLVPLQRSLTQRGPVNMNSRAALRWQAMMPAMSCRPVCWRRRLVAAQRRGY